MGRQLEQNNTNRVFFWDNIKGLLIWLVVFGHFVLDADLLSGLSISLFSVIWSFIYVFHMPVFVFVSGYFGRLVANRDIDSRIKNLTFIGTAYLILQALFIICNFLQNKDVDIFFPLYSSWYLLALFIWRAISPRLKRMRLVLPLSIAASLVVGYISQLDRTLAIGRVIAFFPFYLAGYFLIPQKISSLRAAVRKNTADFISAVALLIAGLGSGLYLATNDLDLNVVSMGAYQSASEVFSRLILLIVAGTIIFGLVICVPDKKILYLTKAGRNSFAVFFIHRFFVLLFFSYCYKHLLFLTPWAMVFLFAVLTFIIVAVLSVDAVTSGLKDFLDFDFSKLTYKVFVYSALLVSVVLILVIQNISMFITPNAFKASYKSADDTCQIMSDELGNKFEDSYKILFAGDLILLEDQVKNAYTGSEYCFDDMFEYTHKYIEAADLAIGVFEGPMGGDKIPYSQSNFGDGKKLYLNFPDSFAEAIQNAGFDLVTLANNHLMDSGLEGALRTMDVLDELGLNYVGAYRDLSDKETNRVKIIEDQGMTFAILSYTFNFNYHTDSEMMGELNFLSSLLVAPDSEYYDEVKESIKADFELAKSMNPDFIVVLPHMGTQFKDYPDYYQTSWCDYFVELGADIILADHTHSVQPALVDSVDGRDVFIGYCPGNYANIFREYNGDCSILTEVYIDRGSKSIVGGSIIPMWVTAGSDSNYRPIPIYDIVNNPDVRSTITTYDMERVEEVQKHITSVVLGVEIDINASRERFYFDSNGYLREKAAPLDITEPMMEGLLYKKLVEADGVCFIGDSITCGSNNFGYPWYEPVENLISGEIVNVARGGYTVSQVFELLKETDIKNESLFVIAVGTNDIRYNNPDICATSSEEYIRRIDAVSSYILSINGEAEIVYIAPWISFENDPFINVSYDEIKDKNTDFSQALENYCSEKGFIYINPNPVIEECVMNYPQSDYLVDWIHPNMNRGINLYSEAVLIYGAE